MLVNDLHNNMLKAPVRKIQAKVELYNGSTLVNTFAYTDKLKSFAIERVGEPKFFGYGYNQKVNIKLRDVTRELNIGTANSFKIYLGGNGDYISPYPAFNVTEVNRDENTNELSITAYDGMAAANKHTVAELQIDSYTIDEFIQACAALLGYENIKKINVNDTSFDTQYTDGANFDGTETIKDALNDVAEATQTIFYLDKDEALVFKRLDKDGAAALEIDKAQYIKLDSKSSRRLTSIVSATELGDNVEAHLAITGSTQYVRDNAFWELREDIDTLVDNALAAIGGISINQFNCSWRGNYLLEIGDKIALTTKDDDVVMSFVLDDVISYDGTLSDTTQWSYTEDDKSAANSSTLGEALKQTFARVDKQNKQIDMVVSESAAMAGAITTLQLNTQGINASIQSLETKTEDSLQSVNDNIVTLTEKVNASMTSEQVKLEIEKELDNGVGKVKTSTGFTFDDTGLTVSKDSSEMTTTITEDGMTVYKNGEEMLTANNVGVNAVNLHATTFLIVGNNSRFEDYGYNRTGCFFIGN